MAILNVGLPPWFMSHETKQFYEIEGDQRNTYSDS